MLGVLPSSDDATEMAVGLKLGKGTIIAGVTIKTKKIKETKTERLLWHE